MCLQVSIRKSKSLNPYNNPYLKITVPFFNALHEEISAAELEGKAILIAMDANSKLGPEYIHGDPYGQSPNGKVLAEIIDRHALCVANGLQEKREGLITREKDTVNGLKKSVIDFVIISSDLLEHMDKIHIDDQRLHVLTKNRRTKNGIDYSESDHNIINTKFKLTWSLNQRNIIEVFKYNDKIRKVRFKEATTHTKHLSQIVDMKKPIHIVTKKFLKRLKGFIHQCFTKVKIIHDRRHSYARHSLGRINVY